MCYLKVCLFLTLSLSVYGQNGPVVDTKVGQIHGLSNQEFNMYLGVPYGKIDEGNKFAPSTFHPHFKTPYYAQKIPVRCPQIVNGNPHGNIHCLNLNIYTPINKTANHTYPVMVYVHGGGFIEGDGNIITSSPKFLMKHNVVVVTINYRLGLYGFLCAPSIGYSNEGIKDVILALKWIKHNIKEFGGDPNNISLLGHSAGSIIVDTLLLFNKNNVFNKVILLSGNIVSPLIIAEPANEYFVRKVAKRLNFDTNEIKTEELLIQLSNVTSHELVNTTRNYVFRPCIDKTFITETPTVDLSKKTIIVGNTNREMLYFYNADETNYIKYYEMDIHNIESKIPDAYKDVKKFYKTGNLKNDSLAFGTDLNFRYPLEKSVKFYLENGATVYKYIFTYDGGRNFVKIRDNITDVGASHGDELGYIFGIDILTDIMTKEDHIVIEKVTTLWTNFVKYGNPTPKKFNSKLNPWLKLDKNTTKYYNIGSFQMEEDDFDSRMRFWDVFNKMFRQSSYGKIYLRDNNNIKVNNSAMFVNNLYLTLMCEFALFMLIKNIL